jgi:hypothetical protein
MRGDFCTRGLRTKLIDDSREQFSIWGGARRRHAAGAAHDHTDGFADHDRSSR